MRTTGIYCRPSCPAVTPKRANIEFFPTAAAAHEHGYRACKRCRPDASPGSPEWDVRGDVVARAMRLIGDGVVDREGVAGLARRLHYSERHLNRLITDELGAGPLAIARAQRATTARVLIETSSMPFTAIAFAAGFRSVRQFNDTVQAVFAASPSQLRAAPASATRRRRPATRRVPSPSTSPCASRSTSARRWRSSRPGRSAGSSTSTATGYRRSLALPNGHGVAVVDGDCRRQGAAGRTCASTFRLADWRDLAPAVRRVRRLLDLDADPVAIDAALGSDPVLAAARRAPARAARAGQRRSVRDRRARRRRPAGLRRRRPHDRRAPRRRRRDAAGARRRSPHARVPVARASWPAIDPALLPMPMRRRATLIDLADRVALGKIVARRRRRPRRRAPRAARRARHRTVDRRLRADARPRRSRRVPAADLGVSAGARPRSERRPHAAERVAAVALLRPAPSVGKEPTMNQPSSRQRTTVDSPIGTITLVADDDALVEVHLPDEKSPSATVGRGRDARSSTRCSAQAASELGEYFAGDRVEFDVPLAPHGTAFQLAAWQALRTIPYGETVSYGEQARRLGDRNLARAVGAANGRNPLPIIVPCHRVVGANGHLTGFGGGIECKAWLLDHERAVRQRTALSAAASECQVVGFPAADTPMAARSSTAVRRGRGRGRTARGAGRPPPACACGPRARLALSASRSGSSSSASRRIAGAIGRGSSRGQLDDVVVLEQVADDGGGGGLAGDGRGEHHPGDRQAVALDDAGQHLAQLLARRVVGVVAELLDAVGQRRRR